MASSSAELKMEVRDDLCSPTRHASCSPRTHWVWVSTSSRCTVSWTSILSETSQTGAKSSVAPVVMAALHVLFFASALCSTKPSASSYSYLNAFKQKHCLRMVIARHYDPTCSANDIRNAQPGKTDAEKARSCYSVCLERGTMLEPGSTKCARGARSGDSDRGTSAPSRQSKDGTASASSGPTPH